MQVAATPFKRITYTEAIELLQGVVAEGKKTFEFPVSYAWNVQRFTATPELWVFRHTV